MAAVANSREAVPIMADGLSDSGEGFAASDPKTRRSWIVALLGVGLLWAGVGTLMGSAGRQHVKGPQLRAGSVDGVVMAEEAVGALIAPPPTIATPWLPPPTLPPWPPATVPPVQPFVTPMVLPSPLTVAPPPTLPPATVPDAAPASSESASEASTDEKLEKAVPFAAHGNGTQHQQNGTNHQLNGTTSQQNGTTSEKNGTKVHGTKAEETPKGPPPCGDHSGACLESRCCKNDQDTCFMKNKKWAVCLPRCRLGNHSEDPEKFRSPWSCDVMLSNGTVMPFMKALEEPDAFIRLRE